MNTSISATVPVIAKSIITGDPVILNKEVRMRERLIEKIKQEVAEDWDNLNNPVPVFEMAISEE